MAHRIAHKLRGSQGFSLTEMLAVVIIMTLASMVVATGIPAAIRAYEDAVDAANAQVLLSTTIGRMRDELSVADTDPMRQPSDGEDPGKSVTFTSLETGCLTTVRNATETDKDSEGNPLVGVVMEAKYTQMEAGVQVEKKVATQLAPTQMRVGASKTPLVCQLTSLTYQDGVFTANLRVIRGSSASASELAKAENVTIRPVATT